MVLNGKTLLRAAPIMNMQDEKVRVGDTTYGLGEAGYDISIDQEIIFTKTWFLRRWRSYSSGLIGSGWYKMQKGRFVLASSIEFFNMPKYLVGIVHDKSSLARQGLSVFNTVIEPGWKGYLTLELMYHGDKPFILPHGSGIAQVIFHRLSDEAQYEGRYQNQASGPVSTIRF